ncbi:MAG: DUF3054 domain-containing protein [Sciscionella sp.]
MRRAARSTALAVLLDVIVVLVFVTIGRTSHTEGLALSGIASTAWPFLAGAAIGWLAGRVWRRPLRVGSGGVAVWLGALVGGMVLRVISGQGTELSFILVAGAFLALFLLGWRGLALLITRRRLGPAQHQPV